MPVTSPRTQALTALENIARMDADTAILDQFDADPWRAARMGRQRHRGPGRAASGAAGRARRRLSCAGRTGVGRGRHRASGHRRLCHGGADWHRDRGDRQAVPRHRPYRHRRVRSGAAPAVGRPAAAGPGHRPAFRRQYRSARHGRGPDRAGSGNHPGGGGVQDLHHPGDPGQRGTGPRLAGRGPARGRA